MRSVILVALAAIVFGAQGCDGSRTSPPPPTRAAMESPVAVSGFSVPGGNASIRTEGGKVTLRAVDTAGKEFFKSELKGTSGTRTATMTNNDESVLFVGTSTPQGEHLTVVVFHKNKGEVILERALGKGTWDFKQAPYLHIQEARDEYYVFDGKKLVESKAPPSGSASPRP